MDGFWGVDSLDFSGLLLVDLVSAPVYLSLDYSGRREYVPVAFAPASMPPRPA